MRSFHNTTHEMGTQLDLFEQKAEAQEEIIIGYFQIHQKLSASQVWGFFPKTTPITSIRRGCTNLVNTGYLVKLNDQIIGLYDRLEHLYQISSDGYKFTLKQYRLRKSMGIWADL